MVSARVDTGSIEDVARAVGRSGDRCALDVAVVTAGFGQVAGGVMDSGLAGAAGGAARRWAEAVSACAKAVGVVGGGLSLAGRSYDSVEGATTTTFARRQ